MVPSNTLKLRNLIIINNKYMHFNRESVSCSTFMMPGLAMCTNCEAESLWCEILPLEGKAL